METLDNQELNKFYQEICTDINTTQLTEEEGGVKEQIFTELALGLLVDAGETENFRVCYDEKLDKLGRVSHKVNGYALSENYETLDLYVAILKNTDTISTTTKAEVETAITRVTRFLKNALNGYLEEIEESSQIFDLAQTLYLSKEVSEFLTRINIFVLTDGDFKSEITSTDKFKDWTVNNRVIDINYLYNLSEKSYIPIEIEFSKPLPCIVSDANNDEYQSYLAIISGSILAEIYEKYGSRLLEQNVRSFLQFSGKINKGIRNTIIKEPHFFLAFNNGIAATAESIELITQPNGGQAIGKITDLQIVNGGQTTASIYHTWKKDKADLSGISVQLKLSVVKNEEKFGEIVSRISEYANTQNKVTASDLSSNRPFHIELEKLSRTIWASPIAGQSNQTRWFFERARGSFKNALLKEGFTKAKKKAFEIKNPKNQLFSKEDLAKYQNAYQEVFDGKKLVIGPHFVVRGNQKNYVQFVNHNLIKKPDSIYFEDSIAKAIIFRSAEKIYGVKPNSIGDMRFLTVPYSISWLGLKTNYKLDLFKIWKNQTISDNLKELFYKIMIAVESRIKEKAQGSLYQEWGKKEDAWFDVREQNFGLDLSVIKSDLEDGTTNRRRITDDETKQAEITFQEDRLRSVHYKTWLAIEQWGNITGKMSTYQQNMANNVKGRISNNRPFSDSERQYGIEILDLAITQAPELLYETEDFFLKNLPISPVIDDSEITLEIIKGMVDFDRKNRILKDHHFKVMLQITKGEKILDSTNKKFAQMNLEMLRKKGFDK